MTSTNSGGPQVGDRVEVTITGTVLKINAHGGPNLYIELDPDVVVAGDFCPECGTSGVECEDSAHAWRDQVTTFEAPDRVVLLSRGGAR